MVNIVDKLNVLIKKETSKDKWSEKEYLQLEKLIDICNSNDNKFIISKNSEYVIFENDDIHFNKETRSFTLDINELYDRFDVYIKEWYLPTVEGFFIDMFLI